MGASHSNEGVFSVRSEAYLCLMGTMLHAGEAVSAAERACTRSESADELLAELSDLFHRVIPHDGSAWFGIDPTTMIATAPSRIENLDASLCDTFWHVEFHEEDPMLYTNIARGDGVGTLHQLLDGRVGKSVRYRELVRPYGYDDELRGVFTHGDNTWGVVSLYRERSRPPFDEHETALVKMMSASIAGALRRHVRAATPWLSQPSAPGLIVIDRAGRAISANQHAREWLTDIFPAAATHDEERLELYELRDAGDGVPTPLFALVARARACAAGLERSPARLRIRDRRGRWIVVHASVLSGADSDDEAVALVLEAAKSAEVAPIIIEAFGLTKRERDVLAAIARGGTTAEIAAELFLSQHTVRDYVKTVFEKVGVSSRGELVARLFGEHYSDRLHETMVHQH